MPMVLVDPSSHQQVIYQGTYSKVYAVRTDGMIVWEQPTGLNAPVPIPVGENAMLYHVLGINYVARADAIVLVTGNGKLVALDRRTGKPLLAAPFDLPGEKAVAAPNPVKTLPLALQALIEAQVAPLWGGAPAGWSINNMIQLLLGGEMEVANSFAVDTRSGRLYIAATAPDGVDGALDGVSKSAPSMVSIS